MLPSKNVLRIQDWYRCWVALYYYAYMAVIEFTFNPEYGGDGKRRVRELNIEQQSLVFQDIGRPMTFFYQAEINSRKHLQKWRLYSLFTDQPIRAPCFRSWLFIGLCPLDGEIWGMEVFADGLHRWHKI